MIAIGVVMMVVLLACATPVSSPHPITVPMPFEEQIAVVYAGVNGHLDKLDPARVTDFEQAFLDHLRSSQKDLLQVIYKEGEISKETDAKLKEVVVSFVETFSQS